MTEGLEANDRLEEAVVGSLLGSAIGDALGLPLEGLSRRRQARMYADVSGYHFFLGRGFVSDDTEHAVMAGQALARSGGEPGIFSTDLAWRMRWWLAALPAGVGLATLRGLGKLWLGWPPHRSGVFSAGNGPAMRSAVIGVCFGQDVSRLKELVRISTRLTHTDPKAEAGALAVAWAAGRACRGGTGAGNFINSLAGLLEPKNEELVDIMDRAARSAADGQTTEDFMAEFGLEKGVTGYMYHTLPAVFQAWFLQAEDFRAAMTGLIRCGGDTDTTASILGGIMGAGLGKKGLPPELIDGLVDWPLTTNKIEAIGRSLAGAVRENKAVIPPSTFWPARLIRNIFFLVVVLAHGFRRLAPPY